MIEPNRAQQTALFITRWIGSTASIIFHTVLFVGAFALSFGGIVAFDRMLLVLTTIVSLEAIYLAIFIQMTLNYASASIEEVEKDIDEIQEDIDEMQEDVEEIQEDVDELQEDVEDIEESEDADEERKVEQRQVLANIQNDLQKLVQDIAKLRK
jgi:uncharacterized protein YoxC